MLVILKVLFKDDNIDFAGYSDIRYPKFIKFILHDIKFLLIFFLLIGESGISKQLSFNCSLCCTDFYTGGIKFIVLILSQT